MADIEFKQGTNTDSAYVDGHKVRLIAIPSGTLELPISATRDSGYVVDGDGKKHKVILATFLTETPEYKDSPTADTAYVTVDGQKVKVTLTAELSSNLQLPKSATADQGYAEDTDGNKHRVTLVATPTGTLQLPNSETDDTAYVIDSDGKKHKVRLFVSTTGPGYIEVVVRGTSPLSLPDAVADGLKYVKAYGDCENRNLPEGYQELEYIEGNNNLQYINTGIVPTSSMSMYFKGQFVSVDASTPTQVAFFLGARDVSTISGIFFQEASATTSLDFFQSGTRWATSHTRAANDIVELKVKNALAQIFINGSSIGTNQFTPNETTQYPILLNALNNIGSPFDASTNVVNRIYRFTIEGICDMIPVKRLSDNEIGMWDKIRKQFFANAGTGAFKAGNAVTAPIPTAPQDIWCNNGAIKAIRPIKYLESTGTQYIDTGVLPTLNTKLVVKATRIAVGGFAGSRDGADSNSTMMAFATNGTSVIIDFNNGNNVPYRVNHTIGTGIITIIAESSKDARRLYDENGTLLAENTTVCSDTFTATKNMTLFNCNGGSISGGCRIYYAQIWDGDTLVRDMIPALDANNIPCMFDKVEGKCYYNAGTGQFIAGYLPAEYEELEYIQGASNVQYINTNIIPNSSMSIYAKVQLVSDTETTATFFFGGRTQSAGGTGVAGMWTPTELVFDWFGSSNADRYSVSATRTTGDVLEYTINNSLVTIKRNGTVAGTHQFTPIGTSTQPLYINGMNNGGTVVLNNSAKARIYRFTVAGVCDMIPARKRSNGHIGMYDLVRRQFFENAGEGQFTMGKLPILPETYTQLEYLESTGTQWLETGVSIAGGCIIEAKAKVMENQFIIGSQVSGQPDTTRCRVYFDGANQGLLAQKLNVTATLAPIADTSQPFEFKMDTIGTGFYFYVNGSLIYSNASSGTIGSQTNNGIKIAYNNATSTAYKQTVYWVKIYNSSNVLVRYLIPAKRNSDSVVGMYDIMNDVFLTNQGTGDFEYGSEIPDSRESHYYVDGIVEKVGTRSAGNKNLFNGVFEQGGLYQGNLVVADTRIRTPDYLTFPAGTYTISCGSAYEVWIEKNNASSVNWYSSYTFTAAATDKFKVAVRSKTDPATTIIRPDDPVNVQIEAGSTATAYVPYCDGGLAICENLLGIDSTQDIQEILTGSITRKVAVWVFNGTESWSYDSTYKRFIITTPKQMKPGGTRATPLLSTHFDCYDSGGAYSAVPNNQFYKTGQTLHFKTNDWDGVTQWTAWLRQQYDSGTPIIVVYPLAADETESVAGQTLTVSAGNNTAEIIQASIDDLELEVKYEKNA